MPERSRYDPITLLLHALLAGGIVAQLVLSQVMTVPAGRGLGVRDWHRAAFEIHAKVGLAVTAVVVLHWIWTCLPFSRPGVAYLFPWLRRDMRPRIACEFADLLRLRIAARGALNPLAGTVHGLGILAVTGAAAGGVVNYLGYFIGEPIPRVVLHWVGRWHLAMGYVLIVFVAAHVLMAIAHWARWRERTAPA